MGKGTAVELAARPPAPNCILSTALRWSVVRIVALETTELIGSVAALIDGKLLVELKLNPHQRSAQSLAPGVKKLLEDVRWRADEVDLVACTVGPGSFTGLRVGVTTAKALAYCTGADILGIDTLEAIAAGAPADVRELSVAVDAQRGQVAAGSFRRGQDGWFEPDGPWSLIDVQLWLDRLAAGTVVSGPVLRKLISEVPDHVTVLDPRYWPPSASSVARLAQRQYAAGHRHDVWTLVPRYSRRSAAEEKAEEKAEGGRRKAEGGRRKEEGGRGKEGRTQL